MKKLIPKTSSIFVIIEDLLAIASLMAKWFTILI